MREVTDETFELEVLKAGRPVVVDFWAPWCGPCKAVEPVLEEISRAHGDRLDFARLNIDENYRTASRYHVLSIPTVILFADGDARESVVGARSQAHYERAWAPWLS